MRRLPHAYKDITAVMAKLNIGIRSMSPTIGLTGLCYDTKCTQKGPEQNFHKIPQIKTNYVSFR